MTLSELVPFQQNALFRAIPADRLALLGLDPEIAVFAAGEIIFEEGSSGNTCYLVESGMVRISKATANAAQETLGFIGPGEFFGEIALFYAAPRSARATASTATRMRILDRVTFERVRELAPLELTTAVAHAGIEHLRHVNSHLADYLSDADRFHEIGVAVAMIAHDTRSPLATIKNAAQLLEELLQQPSPDREQLLRFIHMIERTAGNALDSLDDLLADIRGETERVEVSTTVHELVQEVSAELQGLLRARSVQFEAVVEYDGSISCERRELVRALVNLLRNAIEAVPPASGIVRLHATRDGDSVVFAVSDTGCGIPPEHQARIFERRFTHGKTGGTGLGLSQVRTAVERHRGSIDLESRVGVGTTFRVRIPERRVDASGEVRS